MIEGPRPKFLLNYNNFIKILWKKIFEVGGTKKSTILALFSKIDPRNFDQFGKSVFFETSFFSKNRGNGGLFLEVRPENFFMNLY